MVAKRQLLIGWASTSITPDKPVQLQGLFHERISEYVRDPVTATALALETIGPEGPVEQAVMVSCDLAHVSAELVQMLRKEVARRLKGFNTAKLFVNATHTHTGPVVLEGFYPEPPAEVMRPSEYGEFFVERVTEAIAQAWHGRQPGGISRALGHAAVGFNRRVVYDDGTAKMYGPSDTPAFMEVEGTQDHGLEMLFSWDEEAELTGVVVNIACPSQVVARRRYISADFWASARARLRTEFSEELFVYPMTSSSGDQCPRDLVRRGRGEPDMRAEDGLEEMARRIANGVIYAFETAQSEVSREVVFVHHAETLDLPMRKVTIVEAEEARRAAEELTKTGPVDPQSGDGRWLERHQGSVDRYEQQGEDPRHEMDLHVIRLGDVAVVTNPFELFLDYGLQMKARSKAEQTFVVQLANDRGIYLPTEKAMAHGHYGAMIYDNLVGPEGGRMLVDRTVDLINGMWD